MTEDFHLLHGLLQEAKGIADHGSVTDHLDAAEGVIERIEAELSQALSQMEVMREALAEMVYEATHLSPMEADGSHWCKISGPALTKARAALAPKSPS